MRKTKCMIITSVQPPTKIVKFMPMGQALGLDPILPFNKNI